MYKPLLIYSLMSDVVFSPWYNVIQNITSYYVLFVTMYDHDAVSDNLMLVSLFAGNIVKRRMSHIMRKPVYARCEQQRCRSACASVQSDQRLCCSLPRLDSTSSFYIWNFKPLPSFCCWAGWFESTLVANPRRQVFSQQGSYILINKNLHSRSFHMIYETHKRLVL